MLPEAILAILGLYEFFTQGSYQDAVIEYMYARENAGVGGLLVLGCGFGKTFMAIAIILIVGRARKLAGNSDGRTLCIMPNNLVEQVYGHLCSYLARQGEDSRVVVLKEAADVSALLPDSIGLITYNRLEKLAGHLTEAGFTRIIAGGCLVHLYLQDAGGTLF
jgi:superfamily II DNA or RNA helicase